MKKMTALLLSGALLLLAGCGNGAVSAAGGEPTRSENDLLWNEFVLEIAAKLNEQPCPLNPVQKNAAIVSAYINHCCNGGHLDFFDSWDFSEGENTFLVQEVEEALAAVGAQKYIQPFRSAARHIGEEDYEFEREDEAFDDSALTDILYQFVLANQEEIFGAGRAGG
ncbi:MAG: hypothetical protein LBJ11_04440 [Oscillospiraceae bacterium]|jgi:hypothetical protein|nr:hypothetical protein [Oscillospiraceae bacterium]